MLDRDFFSTLSQGPSLMLALVYQGPGQKNLDDRANRTLIESFLTSLDKAKH